MSDALVFEAVVSYHSYKRIAVSYHPTHQPKPSSTYKLFSAMAPPDLTDTTGRYVATPFFMSDNIAITFGTLQDYIYHIMLDFRGLWSSLMYM
jgi:hypothetical protein